MVVDPLISREAGASGAVPRAWSPITRCWVTRRSLGPSLALESTAVETLPVEAPEVRYAQSGDVNIAYSIVGDGPFDVVFSPAG